MTISAVLTTILAMTATLWQATVDRDGLSLGEGDTVVHLRLLRVETEGTTVHCPPTALFTIDRNVAWRWCGRWLEGYVFLANGVEQVVGAFEPPGAGSVRVVLGVQGEVAGRAVPWSSESETDLGRAGLRLRPADSEQVFTMLDGVAVDVAGRAALVAPYLRGDEIVLDIPESFVASAVAPWIVDPWVELGGSASGGGVSATLSTTRGPVVAVDSKGSPVVAWQEFSDIYIRRWNGAAWAGLGGSDSGGGVSNTPHNSGTPTLAIDRQDRPLVAWSEEPLDGTHIHLRRWAPGAWEQLGNSATGTGVSGTHPGLSWEPQLALDPSGNPIVAWREWLGLTSSVGDHIYVRQWTGLAWSEFAGSASGTGIVAPPEDRVAPSLAVDGAGHPTVTWHGWYNSTASIYLSRWDGAQWGGLGGSASAGGIGSGTYASVVVETDGRPHVAWQAWPYNVVLARWGGAAWGGLGGSEGAAGVSQADSVGQATEAKVVIDAQGYPMVAWRQNFINGQPQIYLRRWNGTAWLELGGSASGTGVSASPGSTTDPEAPSLALDADGNPVVAWHDYDGSRYNVFLRRWFQASPVDLRQWRLDGASLPVSGSVSDGAVRFSATVTSDIAATEIRLQLELKPVLSDFDAGVVAESPLLPSGSSADVTLTGLASGTYHWRARTRDALGHTSEWVAFGSNDESQADFAWDAGGDAEGAAGRRDGPRPRGCGCAEAGAPLWIVALALSWQRSRQLGSSRS